MQCTEALLKVLANIGILSQIPDADIIDRSSDGPIRSLAQRGLLKEWEAIEKVAERLKISTVDLGDKGLLITFDIRRFNDRVNPDFCWEHKIIPLSEEDQSFSLAMANPLDHDAIKAVEFAVGKCARICIAEELKILKLLGDFLPPTTPKYSPRETAQEGMDSFEIISTGNGDMRLIGGLEEIKPIVDLCNKIISQALRQRASDVHIEPLQHCVEVRYRIDGQMKPVLEVPVHLQLQLISRLKLSAGMNIAERRRPQDGRMRVRVSGENLDLRASSVPTAYGEKIVLRLLMSDSQRFSFESLSFPSDIETKIKKALSHKGRLLLVTGPTGSGKTTTLYTFLQHLKSGSTNIETVEDPIEYRISGINQIQVNESIDVTFSSALRSILRQDPDVIMVGEIRDKDTASIALQAAQTGHIVLSTLHTNDALSSITRLLSLGIERYSIATGLAGVLSQRLVRSLCPDCKKESSHPSLPGVTLYAPQGCKECSQDGYRGRVGVYSYFEVTKEIANLIHEGATSAQLERESIRQGYESLGDAAIKLLRAGTTSFDEIKDLVVLEPEEERSRSSVAPPPTDKETAKLASSPSLGRTLQKKKIVIVDDDPNIRTLFSMILSKERYEVVEASDGAEGLDQVYAHDPVIVLCDLMMPNMSGKEFLLHMRSNPDTALIPVVFITAAATEENEVELIGLGARDFISKTSSSAVILARLRRALSPN
jgi:type II secretory ATPase GspE/PulE/Tfp pilus assembly ATPase PilB-like protein